MSVESLRPVERGYVLCSVHTKILDDYARAFPPAVETSYTASRYLFAMAADEAPKETILCPACAVGKVTSEPEIESDYACLRAVRCALSPDVVTLDQALLLVESMEPDYLSTLRLKGWEDGFAKMNSGRLEILTKDHRGNPLPLLVLENVTREGRPRTGKNLRFVLTLVASGAPGVYKLAPSVNIPGKLRAFFTLVEP